MSNENKTQGQLLEEQLLMVPKNGGESLAAEENRQSGCILRRVQSFLKARKTDGKQWLQAIEIPKSSRLCRI